MGELKALSAAVVSSGASPCHSVPLEEFARFRATRESK
jgi:hypothetical protein